MTWISRRTSIPSAKSSSKLKERYDGLLALALMDALTTPSDGTRGVHQTGQGDLDELYTRLGQLPKQMSPYQVRLRAHSLPTVIKLRICRGWDDLFSKCSENLNSLTAMKLSPYYKGAPINRCQ